MQSETTYPAILGQIIRELRKAKGIEQSEIAEKMGINRSSWSQIENGNVMVNIHQLQEIGKNLGREAHQILLDADTIADSMKERGCKVHYDSAKEVQAKSSGSQGLALIGAGLLGLFVGSVLFSKESSADDKKDKP